MPLPTLKPQETSNQPKKSLRERIFGKKAPKDAIDDAPSRVSSGSNQQIKTAPSRVSSSLSQSSIAENQTANQKAIEISQGRVNPLIPLITYIYHTLLGMNSILLDIDKNIKIMSLKMASMNGNGSGPSIVDDIAKAGLRCLGCQKMARLEKSKSH